MEDMNITEQQSKFVDGAAHCSGSDSEEKRELAVLEQEETKHHNDFVVDSEVEDDFDHAAFEFDQQRSAEEEVMGLGLPNFSNTRPSDLNARR